MGLRSTNTEAVATCVGCREYKPVYLPQGAVNRDWFCGDCLTRERDELRAEVERLERMRASEARGGALLIAEVERLQRENGALARTYALSEEKLRQRTEAMNDAQSEVTTLEWQLSEATKEIERLQAPPHGPTAYSDTGEYDDGGKWADLQSDTEAIDGDQVL
jgi:hypothetical protein